MKEEKGCVLILTEKIIDRTDGYKDGIETHEEGKTLNFLNANLQKIGERHTVGNCHSKTFLTSF